MSQLATDGNECFNCDRMADRSKDYTLIDGSTTTIRSCRNETALDISEELLWRQERAQARLTRECKDTGEHFARIISSGGNDLCDNCGGTA